MSIWISIAIAALSIIIPWLLKLISGGQILSNAEKKGVNHLLYLMGDLEDAAVKLGCQPGGIVDAESPRSLSMPIPDEPS